MIRHALLTLALALLAAGAEETPAATSPARPNVILIMADDLGYRDLSCYGHPEIRTPVLDSLAANGVRLTNFHSGGTVCTPARMALLTGAYPVRVGWTRGVIGYRIGMREGLSPEALTIADIFRSEGYATGISGKWHVGSRPDTLPHAQGFDEAYYIRLSNNQTTKLWQDEELVEDPFENRRLTERFTDAAIRFIHKHRDRPFFLYLPYSAPHFPVEAHPEWDGRSGFGAYGDVVEEMDARIGDVLKTLADLDLDNRTLVIFTSDNGPQGGQKATALPYRGGKWSPLEGGTRVPFIARLPGVIPAASESDSLAAAIDLLPTLSRAAGIDWKSQSRDRPKIDGLDLWDTLTGTADKPHPRQALLHWQGMSPEPQAIQSGSWKLFFDARHALDGMGVEIGSPEHSAAIRRYHHLLDPDAPPRPFLFNLDDDPGETEDLSERHPEKVEALRKLADSLRADLATPEPMSLAPPGQDEPSR